MNPKIEIAQGSTGALWTAELEGGVWTIFLNDDASLPGVTSRLREILEVAPSDVKRIVVRTGGSVHIFC